MPVELSGGLLIYDWNILAGDSCLYSFGSCCICTLGFVIPLNLLPATVPRLAIPTRNVFNILTISLRFDEDDAFWWGVAGQPLACLFEQADYNVQVQFIHMLFFYSRVLPYLGPRPSKTNKPFFKSFMTDDHTPVEISWVIHNGKLNVRYCVEPVGTIVDSEQLAALRMVHNLKHLMHDLDLRWFDILRDTLVSSSSHLQESTVVSTKHNSQYFVGFDCDPSGHIKLKAYFLPEMKAAQTALTKRELVTKALATIEPRLLTPWEEILGFFDKLPLELKPEIEFVATDCSPPEQSRIKVYVRTRSTTFVTVRQFMTLSGQLKGSVVDDAIEAVEDLWRLVMGMDTSTPGWDNQRLRPRMSADATDDHLTGGLIFYFELRVDERRPFPKLYLPVRHYCSDDAAVARGMESYYRSCGQLPFDTYVETIQKTFGSHRSLGARTGIHTYVSLAIKKADFEVTSYFNPEAYAAERVSADVGSDQ
ncbi:unnamed protein product [Somion occarium]|uniref:Uncharacterized protein n=1 Tax=Somion occarium TaxID=3059160 RepID=A0ABP1CL28_9APHY